MDVERNKAIVRRTATELFSKGDLHIVDDIIAADAIDHCEPPGTDCRAHFRQVVTMLRSAFPDLTIEVTDMVAEGNEVAARLAMTGTHRGPFLGLPPTGRRFSSEQMRFMRFRDGQMTDSWSMIDFAGWRAQLAEPRAATASD